MFGSLSKGFCDLVYPPHCFICHLYHPRKSPLDILCPNCFDKISLNKPPFCLKCSRQLNNPHSYSVCSSCLKYDPQFDFCWAATLYEEPIRHLIHSFKFNQKTQLRFLFNHLIISFIRNHNLDIEQFDIFIPIPLSTTRLRERTFNQSQLITEILAKHYQKELSINNLIRQKHTRHQTELSPKERWTNIQGAFRIKNPKDIYMKNILIIDDLLTTGATASEASRLLKTAGAKKVGILTLSIA